MGKFFSFGIAEKYINKIVTVKEVLGLNLIKMSNGEAVRLIGVVPPKTSHGEGISFLNKLILGKNVTLEYDKSRKDKNGYTLAFVYFNSGKNFDAIKGIDFLKKYKGCVGGFEAPDEMNEQPKDLFVLDKNGNNSINPEVTKRMKPRGDLYIQLNVSLISCGFADFKSMTPDTCMDSMFKSEYKVASEQGRGIWAV